MMETQMNEGRSVVARRCLGRLSGATGLAPDPTRSRNPLRLLLVVSLLAFVFFVAACGGDDDDSASTSTSASTPSLEGKKGGTLKQLGSSDVDFVDPVVRTTPPAIRSAYPRSARFTASSPGRSTGRRISPTVNL